MLPPAGHWAQLEFFTCFGTPWSICIHTLAYVLFRAIGANAVKARNPLNIKVLLNTAMSACLAMGLGMTMVLAAQHEGNAGMVAILSSIKLVLLLPLL